MRLGLRKNGDDKEDPLQNTSPNLCDIEEARTKFIVDGISYSRFSQQRLSLSPKQCDFCSCLHESQDGRKKRTEVESALELGHLSGSLIS